MTPEVMKRWCKALRSGEYDQTSSYLKLSHKTTHLPAGYCCLGVLLDIEGTDFDKNEHYFQDAFSKATLTDEFLDAVGLTQHEANEFSEMNDAGRSFEDIAEQIMETLV